MATAAGVVAAAAPAQLAEVFNRAADLLALGADPDDAWSVADTASSSAHSLVTMVRRSARAGSSPAHGLMNLAVAERERASDMAAAAAERASVKISGPLGLCFLPAFVCLGIVPVVIGLAGNVLSGGLL